MFDDTAIDGEEVALDESGRPDFHRLQHFTADASRIHYFVFDLLVLKQRDLKNLPLTERQELLKSSAEMSNCSDMRSQPERSLTTREPRRALSFFLL